MARKEGRKQGHNKASRLNNKQKEKLKESYRREHDRQSRALETDNLAPSNTSGVPAASERGLKNGRHAFPQLRNFYKLKPIKGETLHDQFMSAMSTHQKHLWCNYKDKLVRNSLRGTRMLLQRADKFVLETDLVRKIGNASYHATDEKIFDVFNNAIPPFDNMWIETERNSKLFTDDGDGAYEQVGWHIQRGGSFRMPGVTAMALAPDNVIIITKYIKFAKAHANPDDLFRDADIEYKMNKLPQDGGGAYYICDLSIAIGEGSVPEKMQPHDWNVLADKLRHRGNPTACLGEQWMETIQNAQPHIKRNLSSRLSRVCSYAYDLGHNLARFSNGYHEGTNGIVTTMATIPGKTIVNVYDTTLQHYEDDIRILAWALSDFNYNWIFKEPAPKAKRRNRSESFRQATIETRTIEIELPKPRGKEMHEQQYGDGTPRKWHKVRGHWRVYKKTGHRVWIESHERGSKKRARFIKITS